MAFDVAKAVGSRFGDARTKPLEDFLGHLLSHYDSQKAQRTRALRLVDILEKLGDYPNDFHPTSIRARCFLWLHLKLLDLETKLLHGTSGVLRLLATPRFKRRREPLPLQVLFSPHAALMLLWRVTVDVAEDIIVAATTEDKTIPPVVAVLLDLLKDTEGLSLTFLTSGHLGGYNADPTKTSVFQLGAGVSGDRRVEWLGSYSQCLDQTFRSGGAVLTTDDTRESVRDFILELQKWR
jgi:hypothetical protein